MEWKDTGILLTSRAHGESSAIISVLTERHGRYSGVVRGGASRKLRPVLQPGATLAVQWRARLEAHLGAFVVEPIASRAELLGGRETLAGLNAVTSLSQLFLPEREPHPAHYAATDNLLSRMGADEGWPAYYVLWEIEFLAALGYRLSLQNCAVTGASEGLEFVSPKSGSAVTRAAAGDWRDRLLPLPPFLRPEPTQEDITASHIQQGLALSGYFFDAWLCPASGVQQLPPARNRLVEILSRQVPVDLI